MMIEFVLLIFFVILLLILTFIPLMKSCERFENNTPKIVNKKKSILFNTNGLYNFYSSGDKESPLYKNRENYDNYVSYILNFNQTYIDDYCVVEEESDSSRCKHNYIDNFASSDQYFLSISSTQYPCSNVNSVIGTKEENSMVRVFDNMYSLKKRCVRFKNIDVETINFAAKTFKINVSGDLRSFVLSMPIFISFGIYGVFQIVYGVAESMFDSYSDSKTQSTFFVIKGVEEYQESHLTPVSSKSILDILTNINTLPINIYYLNYIDRISLDVVNCNSLTLIFSHLFFGSFQEKMTQINIPTINNSSQSLLKTSSVITINYNNSSIAANELMSIKISAGQMNSDAFSIDIPLEFLTAVAFSRKSGKQFRYHIVFTYSMDMVNLVCFFESDNIHNVWYKRQTIVINNSFVHLVYDYEQMKKNLSMVMENEMDQYSDFMTISSIPNYAYVAKYLGYDA